MSAPILQAISRVLEAKSHEPIVMNRGVLVSDLSKALGIPHTSINQALRDSMECARYGIFKLTPNRKRYALWAFSQDVLNKALAGPFDNTAGIDPKVQAAEVNKVVAPCPDNDDHRKWGVIASNIEKVRGILGLSEDTSDGDIVIDLFETYVMAKTTTQENNNGEDSSGD